MHIKSVMSNILDKFTLVYNLLSQGLFFLKRSMLKSDIFAKLKI